MAKVHVQIVGGSIQEKEFRTVSELKQALGVPNHQASVSGEPVDDNYELCDYDYVSLAPKVKGAGESAK